MSFWRKNKKNDAASKMDEVGDDQLAFFYIWPLMVRITRTGTDN